MRSAEAVAHAGGWVVPHAAAASRVIQIVSFADVQNLAVVVLRQTVK
jgi:hypothetical protein